MSGSAWGILAAVIVAGVLLPAGVLKLARPTEWRTQVAGLGVPALIAVVVPLVEIGIGAALLVQWQRHAMAWAAAALFALFTALLGVRLAQGQPAIVPLEQDLGAPDQGDLGKADHARKMRVP